MALATRLTDLPQRRSKRDQPGLILVGCHPVSLGNIDTGRIASVTIMAIDTLENVGILGLALLRDVKMVLFFLPPVGLAMANRTLVFLRV